MLFVGFLVDNKCKSTTIKSYISAIKAVLLENNVSINEDWFLLSALTRTCKIRNNCIFTRLPIQKDLLRVILDTVQKSDSDQPYLSRLYSALFSTAYFGLLRIGEITSGSHPILARDVHIAHNKEKILLILRTSKMHGQGSKPQLVKINSRQSKRAEKAKMNKSQFVSQQWCPYRLLRDYIAVRGPYHKQNEPMFILSGGAPVTPQLMRSCLKRMLTQAGFDKDYYSVQSLRSGRATDLLKLGISVETIRKLGRWKSNAVFMYLR